MRLFKSIVGGVCGFALGGPIGAILGASIAYQFDNNEAEPLSLSAQTQHTFFVSTFLVMGNVAKANGRVHSSAINYARQLMNELYLNEQQCNQAIQLFRQGKLSDFRLEPVLAQFYQDCHAYPELCQRFLLIQLQTAVVDGELSTVEDVLLLHIAARLRISRFNYERLKMQLLAQQYFYQQKAHIPQTSSRPNVAEAYQVLGLKPDASFVEVKKAYRRLMNQHHPDKLAAKGLSDAQMMQAKEKTQQISKAYETIQKFSKQH